MTGCGSRLGAGWAWVRGWFHKPEPPPPCGAEWFRRSGKTVRCELPTGHDRYHWNRTVGAWRDEWAPQRENVP